MHTCRASLTRARTDLAAQHAQSQTSARGAGGGGGSGWPSPSHSAYAAGGYFCYVAIVMVLLCLLHNVVLTTQQVASVCYEP